MPTYEYECTECGRVFEVFQSITEKPKRHLATDCGCGNGRAPVRRLIGAGSGILFKGNGFHQTDYRSESYKKAAKAESEAANKSDTSSNGKPSPGESSKPKPEKPNTDKKPAKATSR